MKNLVFLAILSALLAFVASCARGPLRGPENAMRKASVPDIVDDLPLTSMLAGINDQIAYIEKSHGYSRFVFGEDVYSKEEYLAGLRRFAELIKRAPDLDTFKKSVEKEFHFYEVYGQKNWGDVFITSYFEPLIQGSLKKTKQRSQPLYKAPDDLISLDLSTFDPRFSKEKKLRGRIVGKSFVPYFSREEIDAKQSLKGKNLEICWVDPVDAFFLQIQGSGTVELPGGKRLRLNYAEKNGHSYESVGRFLKPYIPEDQLNLHTIEAYLRKMPPEEIQRYFNMNPSYVFFQVLEESALTYMGVPATDGRTIATDSKYFPKGAIGFLQFEKPVFDSPSSVVPAKAEPAGRFVLDQDIGGAIQGGGRVDLFWGRGAEAKLYAGAIKSPGKLYYLAPKKEFLNLTAR
jgi:membrane-bound lytic murein transglycosylase A